MKIAVIGAGVTGISTAYELARDGHAVTVLERNSALAEGASFATGPLWGNSLVHPLCHPPPPSGHWLQRVLADSAPPLRAWPSMADLAWLVRWKTQAATDWQTGMDALHGLASYSGQRMQALCHDESIQFEQASGQLVLLHDERQLRALDGQLQWLKEKGTAWKKLDRSEAVALEPALGQGEPFFAALLFEGDGLGNCRQFTQVLKERTQALGVQYHFSTPIAGFSQSLGVELHSPTQTSAMTFDQVVLCTGPQTPDMLGLLGQRLPMTRVQGVSLSAAIREPLNAPRAAVLDMESQVTMARLGSRLRITGAATLGNARKRPPAADAKLLYQVVQKYFPGAIQIQGNAQVWRASSLFTPDGLPAVGALGSDQGGPLWINSGHGHQGWALASGSARLLADLIARRPPTIDAAAFAPTRLHRR